MYPTYTGYKRPVSILYLYPALGMNLVEALERQAILRILNNSSSERIRWRGL